MTGGSGVRCMLVASMRPNEQSDAGAAPGAQTDAGSAAPGGERLLPRVRRVLRTRHYSRRTETAYVAWVRRYVRFHGLTHPSSMGEREVERFLSHLAVTGRVAPSTQNQALAALLFLYRDVLGLPLDIPEHAVRAKGRPRLPVVLSRAEVRAVLGQLRGTSGLSGCCCTAAVCASANVSRCASRTWTSRAARS